VAGAFYTGTTSLAQKPLTIEVVQEAGGRFLVSTFPDGKVVREQIDPKAKREPRRPPRARIKRLDHTKRKRF
jgi:hypothetical protein